MNTAWFQDFFPVLCFFAMYQYGGVYPATFILILTAMSIYGIQCYRLNQPQLSQLALNLTIYVFGAMTLAFHNPHFIQWKPTIVYWIIGLVIGGSPFFRKESFLQTWLGTQVTVDTKHWLKMSYFTLLFFVLLGFMNLYIAYHWSMDHWVDFKLFGATGLLLMYTVILSWYLHKHQRTHVTPS